MEIFDNQMLGAFLGCQVPYSPPRDQQNCACLCVVKDEAPYIHEYVHHHLHFGFAPIVILVNRTTDATVFIAQKIASQHPEVICLNCDMIDYLDVPPARMQTLAYAYGIAYLRTRRLARYALLSDADEFWFPLDFSRSISDWLRDFPEKAFEQISFTWLNQFSREEPFVPPFQSKTIRFTGGVKSLIDLTSRIRATHFHFCAFHGAAKHLDARGRPFLRAAGRPHRNAGPTGDHDAYILHRIQRSEPEYIATLSRGRPGNHTMLKDNRRGYLEQAEASLSINDEKLAAYHQSLALFPAECGIEADVATARAARLLDEQAVCLKIRSFLDGATDKTNAAEILSRIFAGTRYVRTVADMINQYARDQ